MAEIPRENFEQPQEAEKPEISEITKEDILVLRENKDFLDFVEKIKSIKYDAEKMGIDLKGTIKYLETGEGDPTTAENNLRQLTEKYGSQIISEAKRRNLITSEEEEARILSKTKYGKLLDEFKFFMSLLALKKKVETRKEEAGRTEEPHGMKETIEKETAGKISAERRKRPEREKIILELRKKFQDNMWETLHLVVDLYKKLGQAESQTEEKSKEILDKINYYGQLLEMRAEELVNEESAREYGISRGEIYRADVNSERYISRSYAEGDDRAERVKQAQSMLWENVKEIWFEKNKLRRQLDEVGQRIDLAKEQKEYLVNKIVEKIRDFDETINKRAERLAEKYQIDKKEVFPPEMLQGSGPGHEPFPSV